MSGVSATARPCCRCDPPCSWVVRVHDGPAAVYGDPYFASCVAVHRGRTPGECDVVGLAVAGPPPGLTAMMGLHRAVCGRLKALGLRVAWYERYEAGELVASRRVEL